LKTRTVAPAASILTLLAGLGVACTNPQPTPLACGAGSIVVHGADGAAASRAGTAQLCVVAPGANATEVSLVVQGDGSVATGVTSRGAGAGGMITKDGGTTWKKAVPGATALNASGVHRAGMGWVVSDPASGRLLVSSLGNAGCSGGVLHDVLSYSDDKGATWTTTGGQLCDGGDWGKTFVGPAAKDATRAALAASGYPNVVYHCSGGSVDVTRYCWRSTDGGRTFTRTAMNAVSGQYPYGAEKGARPGPRPCPEDDDDFNQLVGQGVVADDGAIYMPVSHCSYVSIVKSTDEGDTWQLVPVPVARSRGWNTHGDILGFTNPPNAGFPTNPKQPFMNQYGPVGMAAVFGKQLDMDSAGNLYLAWVNAPDQMLRLSVSTDRGTTWSTPRVISPPEVRQSTVAAITVRSPGVVAVAYYGTKDGTAYDGYLTASRNALDADPVFVSTAVSPAKPLQPNKVGEPIESAGVDIAADGSVWASYARDTCVMSAAATGTECDASLDYNSTRYTLVAAHLTF
jgi:hypothetical protein